MKRSVATLVVVAAFAGQAHATARSVAVLGISGAGGERFADQLEAGLSDLYQVVPGEVYQRTFDRLQRSGASDEELQTVAARLRIDAVIDGALAGDRRARQLLVTVRAGASGRVIARGHYDLAGRSSAAVCQRVLADLVRALDHISPVVPAASRPRAPETVNVVHREAPDDDDDSTPPAPTRSAPAPARRPPAAAPISASRDKEPDDDDDSAPAPPPRSPARPSKSTPPPADNDD